MKLCCDCHDHRRSIGARCEYCYIEKHATRRKIWDAPWFQRNFMTFAAALAARHWAMKAGLEVGPVDELVRIATKNRQSNPLSNRQRLWITSIIRSSDRLAQKEMR